MADKGKATTAVIRAVREVLKKSKNYRSNSNASLDEDAKAIGFAVVKALVGSESEDDLKSRLEAVLAELKPKKKKEKTCWWCLWVVFALIVLFAIVAVLYFMNWLDFICYYELPIAFVCPEPTSASP